MAFISEIFHYHDEMSGLCVPEFVEVSVEEEDLGRLTNFQIATYRFDGSQANIVDLYGTAPELDLNSSWYRFRLHLPIEDDPPVAIVLADFGSDAPVLQFWSSAEDRLTAVAGCAKGSRADKITGSFGSLIQFDVHGNRLDADTSTSALVCLTAGTMIDTLMGPKLIEDLAIGDPVNTFDNGPQKIRLIHSMTLSGSNLQSNRKLWPVCIQSGALGFGVPQRNLLVTQQQRMLYQSIRIPLMFSDDAVFIRAKSLAAGFEEVYVDSSLDTVTYFHLVFDHHEIIFAEGAPTESFMPGPEGIANLDADARAELFNIFPDLRYGSDSHAPDYQTVRSWELKAAVS